ERLGLMFVAGQPKTTASYIQATGRVGRRRGGLVTTFLRASRVRDLNHYEFFAGYHTAMYRHVEPVTVTPFAPPSRDRALGAVSVALLRNAKHLGVAEVDDQWRLWQRTARGWASAAHLMAAKRYDAEVEALPELFEARAQRQPDVRTPDPDETLEHAKSELD